VLEQLKAPAQQFTPDRLEAQGDPWAGILESKQDLAELLGAEAAR
jgi:hypothetical protein